MRAVVTSQFQYCPLVWMFHGRKMNNKTNRLHEKALRISYKDHTSSFVSLLEKDRSVNIPQKNVQLLMTEIFKITNNLNPSFMDEIFVKRSVTYNLRMPIHFYFLWHLQLIMVLKQFDTEGSVFGTLFHMKLRIQILCNNFKNKIKYWNNESCDCRLCRQYIPRLGFL